MQLFYLLRISNWLKNLIIILPAFFSGKLFSLSSDIYNNLFITFFSFCLSSSCIYILNDLLDYKKDCLHPTKSNRPIAAGIISKRQAYFVMVCLAMLLFTLLCYVPKSTVVFILAYLLLNVVYCFVLKHIAILDVTSISLGFVFRLIAGGMVCMVLITHWIIILVFLLMFSIALAKRRDDLTLSETSLETYREAQFAYSIQFIDIAKTISFTVTLVAYIIYTVSPEVIQRVGSNYIYVTALPVLIGILRYLQLTVVFNQSGDPVDLLFKDKFLIIVIFTWLALFYLIIYG